LALASQAKADPERKEDLHPMAKIIPITEHFQHFLAEMEESFWGDLYAADAPGVGNSFFELASRNDNATGFPAGGGTSGGGGKRERLPQWLLRARFRDSVRDDSVAHAAHPGQELSAGGAEAISAPGGRGFRC